MSACSMIGAMPSPLPFAGAALPALLGVGNGALRGALGHRHALRADRQARRVHHDEHDVEAAVLLAHQIADGAVALLAELHHAGRARVDAELVLDAGADHVVGGAERAVLADEPLRHQEQRDAARAGRRIGQARQHEMHDVVGHLVVAVGDENLGAEDAVAAVGLLDRAALELAQVRARVRLGQVHGAGPLARHHLRQVEALQLVRALRLDGVDGAERQQRAQAEGEVGGVPDLAGGGGDHLRQVLPAPFLRSGERAPAAGGELLVGLLPAGRGDDLAVDQLGAGAVAGRAQRLQHLGGELAGLLDDGADGVLVDAAEQPLPDQLIEARRGLERVDNVVYWSLVGHGSLAPSSPFPPLTLTAD